MRRWAWVCLIVLAVSGCSSHPSNSSDRPKIAGNPLANCQPVTDTQLRRAVGSDNLTPRLNPPHCHWDVRRDAAPTQLDFLWTRDDSAFRAEQDARRKGDEFKQVELANGPIVATGWVESNAGAPDTCTVWGAEFNGLFDWVVRRAVDPCVLATQLADLTIQINP